jgi:hypothetical protein
MSDTTAKKALAKKARTEAKQRAERNKNLALNAMIVSGVVIIITFGLGTDWFDALKLNALFGHLGFDLRHHWKSWEFGALSWTLLFVVYYFITVELDTKKHRAMVRVSLILLFVSTVVAVASLLYMERPFVHVISITGVGLFLMSTDGLLAQYLTPGTRKTEFWDSFWIAGVPTVSAYFVLLIYLGLDSLHNKPSKIENPEIFISGAISFQLLASNVIFVILQKGWLRKTLKRRDSPHGTPS